MFSFLFSVSCGEGFGEGVGEGVGESFGEGVCEGVDECVVNKTITVFFFQILIIFEISIIKNLSL